MKIIIITSLLILPALLCSNRKLSLPEFISHIKETPTKDYEHFDDTSLQILLYYQKQKLRNSISIQTSEQSTKIHHPETSQKINRKKTYMGIRKYEILLLHMSTLSNINTK